MARLRLELLGSFKIWLDDRPAAGLFRSEKEKALLAYLAVEAGRPISREALAEFFWPDRPRGLARTSLRQALSGVRKVLGDKQSSLPYFLVSEQTIQFNENSDVWLDVNEFLGLLRSVLIHQHQDVESCGVCLENLKNAIKLYKGGFLDDFYHVESLEYKEWLACHREQYFRYMLSALQKISRYHENRQNYEEAIEVLQLQLSLDPLDEGPRRSLMQVLALNRQRSSAIEQYHLCEAILADQLGVDPAPETKDLYRQIKSGKFGVQQRPALTFTNAGLEMTAFFGREVELERFARCLYNPVCRLLTLVGPPGVGKTRLAMKVAARHEGKFRDGAFVLHTEQMAPSTCLTPALAGIVGLSAEPSNDIHSRLLNKLGEMNALILIDGFEGMLDQTDLLLEILQNAPGLKILVTSRERLNYQAACLFDIHGLPYPDESRIEILEQYPAFNLFIGRAANLRSGFKATDRNRASILKIIQQVDGNPLAIELAAARLDEYTCSEIASSLEDSINLLNTTYKDVPSRHRSMNNALNQSWISLNNDQQEAYLKLKTLEGRFLAEDALQATGVSQKQLSQYVEKSMLIKEPVGCYRMPSLFRLYLNCLIRPSEPPSKMMTDLQADVSQYLDPLTGLASRELFWDRLNHSIAYSRRKQQILAVMLIDAKCINNHMLLHTVEKEVVHKEIANRLRSCLRSSDTITRFSPDEFALIIEDLPQVSDSDVVALKVLGVLKEAYEIGVNLHKLPVRIGISIYPHDGDSTQDLISMAREALDRLEAGKFGRSYYSPTRTEKVIK